MLSTCPQLEELLDKCVTFVLEHRKGKAFINYTPEQIREKLHIAALDKCFLYATDEETGDILGLVHGYIKEKKIFHVENILTLHHNIMPLFLMQFKNIYPGYKLQGIRFDKLKKYNLERLSKKLIKIS